MQADDICSLLKDTEKAMTTVGGFLKTGCLLLAIVSIVTIYAFPAFFEGYWGEISGLYLFCILLSIFLASVWSAYSSFCNASVSTLGNALLTGVVGIIILTKDLLLKTVFIELNVTLPDEMMIEMESIGFTLIQFIDGGATLLTYPLLLMTGMATMICAAKRYWIDKHNDHCDIDTLTQ